MNNNTWFLDTAKKTRNGPMPLAPEQHLQLNNIFNEIETKDVNIQANHWPPVTTHTAPSTRVGML